MFVVDFSSFGNNFPPSAIEMVMAITAGLFGPFRCCSQGSQTGILCLQFSISTFHLCINLSMMILCCTCTFATEAPVEKRGKFYYELVAF